MKHFVSVIFDNQNINENQIVESMKTSAGMALTESHTLYGIYESADDKLVLRLRLDNELTESESDEFAKSLAHSLFEQGYDNFDIEVSANSLELLEADRPLNLNDYKRQIEAAGPYVVNAAGTQVTMRDGSGTVAGVNENGNLWSGSEVITQIVRRGIPDNNQPAGPGAAAPAGGNAPVQQPRGQEGALAAFAQSGEGGIANNPEARDAIRELQERLIALGYDLGTMGADGIYGRRTRAAVQAYQEANGLTVDGDAGPETIGKLLSGSPQPPAEQPPAEQPPAEQPPAEQPPEEETPPAEETPPEEETPPSGPPDITGDVTVDAPAVGEYLTQDTTNQDQAFDVMDAFLEEYDVDLEELSDADFNALEREVNELVRELADNNRPQTQGARRDLGALLTNIQEERRRRGETPDETPPEEETPEAVTRSGTDRVEFEGNTLTLNWTLTKDGDTITGTVSGDSMFDFEVINDDQGLQLRSGGNTQPLERDIMPTLYDAVTELLNESIDIAGNPLLEAFYSEEETYDGDDFFEAYGVMWFNEDEELDEAEYQGRKVKLGKPMRGDVKKFKVYVRNPKGNVVKVNFGDPDMKIKKSNPARRRSFRARHNCDNPGPRHKARYWSCRKW